MGYHVRVKICGVTTPEDARMVAAAGADAIGLNFYPKSPRYIERAVAAAIFRTLPPFVEGVCVFAGETPERMVEHMRRWERMWTIQAHGGRPEPTDVYPFRLIRAVPIENAANLAELTDYLAICRSAGQLQAGLAVLVDARVAGQFGGTGQTAPWHLLADYRPGVPLILAGGLTPENVAEAVRVVRPYAVDVASGVESAPGRKDPDRVRRFIESARAAAAGL
jgi:phosphoribosylanthranilate isomerase